jgi:hypothetical protein
MEKSRVFVSRITEEGKLVEIVKNRVASPMLSLHSESHAHRQP